MYFHQHSVPHNCWAQSQWHSSLLHDSSHMDIKATCASNAMYKSLANLSKYWLAFKRHQGRTGSASAPRWWSMSHTGTGGTGTAAFFFTITISVAFFHFELLECGRRGGGVVLLIQIFLEAEKQQEFGAPERQAHECENLKLNFTQQENEGIKTFSCSLFSKASL